METQKLERLKNLEREVQDFHPLLRILLKRISYIRNMEYKQGPGEKGADFVLEKVDDTLDTTYYIGVIVKVGKIKQDFTEIERQIDECGMERTFDNGKKKIYLSEIWIITNDSITDYAQNKIHHKFKNTSIVFFDVQKVAMLIDKFYPEFWTDISIKLGEYIRKLKGFSSSLTKNSAILEFQENINIEQRVIKVGNKVKPDQGRRSRNQQITIHDALKAEQLLFLEGYMGSGKSNLIKRAIERMTEPGVIHSEKVIPIGMTFKDYLDVHKENLDQILAGVVEESHTDPAKHTYLLIIDGLDEVPIAEDVRKECLLNLSRAVRNTDNIRVLVTSRPIEDLKERNEIDKNFSRYHVLPLTTRQLLVFIEKACDNPVALDRLTKGMERSSLFKNLPKTPISAILLARILKEDPAELPSTMTELYSKYSELVLGRWDMSKGLQSQKEYEVIDSVCMDLGAYVIENGLSDISASEVKGFFDSYVSDRNLRIDVDAVFERFLSKSEIFSYSSRNLTISFKHRTFAEYFAAKKMLRENLSLQHDRIFDPYWCTVYFFLIGLKRDCPELLTEIFGVRNLPPQQEIIKVYQTGQYLLAGYLTPYRTIKEGLRECFSLVAKLLDEGLKGNSPLSVLPPVQLIYLLAHGMSHTYGYSYFEDAITEAIQEKLKSPADERDLYELFFLTTIPAFLGRNNAFDSLIRSHGKHLPELLKLGISHFNEDFSLKSDVTSKYVKKLHKGLKSRGNFTEIITRLYDIPITESISKPLPEPGK
ncbi:NACHT domain-containing protein [Pseudomonas monteilii]